MVGNHSKSAKAEGSLTATPTGGAGTKVGLSDPVVLSGNAIAQRIKATLGITGLSLPRVHIDGVVWHLDVGSSHPGADRQSTRLNSSHVSISYAVFCLNKKNWSISDVT